VFGSESLYLWLTLYQAKARWVREVLLPQAIKLNGFDEFIFNNVESYRFAQQAEQNSPGDAALAVSNNLGQQVALLQNGELDAGYLEIKFDGSGLSRDVYFYRMQTGDFIQTRTLLLLK